MAIFIARMIQKQAAIDIEKGIEKYKAYFIHTTLYRKYKGDVDTILQNNGYLECIVAG